MKSVLWVTVLASSLAVASDAFALDKLSPRVEEFIQSSGEVVKVWVYFSDRGTMDPNDVRKRVSEVVLSERSRERRLKRSTGPLADVHDLPVDPASIAALRGLGCRVRHASKYLNAASVYATPAQIRAVEKLPFVRRIDRVQTARREIPRVITDVDLPPSSAAPDGEGGRAAPALDYGASYGQLDLINVIPLHEADRFGTGVLIAMLDTGFNRGHESLVHLDVVAEWDFINHDPITKNEPGDHPNQHAHGTTTLSVLAGYAPSHLIGPAWDATFALAKTERYDVEIQQEEDDYVRALEWADSLGADIVSSSLGYYDWYTYEDMDGNTAVTTIASDIAASKGIAVITAAGNEGPLPWPGIIAPSDGDSVIAVGAVDFAGVIAGFSSRGPAYDGRIKPDVCAQGSAVQIATWYDSLGYTVGSGTSYATPLVAGAAALCLQMHPFWSPIDLRDKLRAAADHAQNPNNDYGWGVIDAFETALDGATGVASDPLPFGAESALYQNFPNPFVPSVSGNTVIGFRIGAPRSGSTGRVPSARSDEEREVTLAVYDVSGRLVRRLLSGWRSPGEHAVEWDGLDDRGVAVSSGVYYYRLSVGGLAASRKIVLIRR